MNRTAGINGSGSAPNPFSDSPGLAGDIRLIDRSGSDRMFYRLVTEGGRALIIMRYGRGRKENERFVPAARLLGLLGIPTPEILAWDPERRLVWMEDLGDSSLWEARAEPWPFRVAIYQQVLRHAARLHVEGADRAAAIKLPPEREFDETLYLWEQSYFFDNCLGLHFGMSGAAVDTLRNLPALRAIASDLAAAPRQIVHRDLQSQNILIRGGGEAVLIDFQGMRPGHPLYDVASLLLDPYVQIDDEQRDELLDFYLSLAGLDPEAAARDFPKCALQRLMQALGAYGFLGHARGKPEFLDHIPAAIARLGRVARQIPGLETLADSIENLA